MWCSPAICLLFFFAAITVMLSGFKDETEKRNVEKRISELGWSVSPAEFDNSITHVITPSYSRMTLKSLAGALTYPHIGNKNLLPFFMTTIERKVVGGT